MTETSNVSVSSAGTTQESGTTGLTDGPGEDGRDRQLLHGGTAAPADASATADADHPGLPADGALGDETSSGSVGDDPAVRAQADHA